MAYLSNDFLSKYKNNPFKNTLGEFIFLRTYSRWLESKQRRETWKETVQRAVEYSMSLDQTFRNLSEKISESERLFDLIYNLKAFPSGRTLWIGGTEASRKFKAASFNCAGTVIDSFQTILDTFYLLLCGAGVGFRILPEDVEQLSPVRPSTQLEHEGYQGKPKEFRHDYTAVQCLADGVYKIVVGDSKEGWVQALEDYFILLQLKTDKIIINYDHVRPKGELLKTFGGRASGHVALMQMFSKIHGVIGNYKSAEHKLKPVDVLDIQNIIAESVVVGGVRRSSEIALFDVTDQEVMSAKYDLWTEGSSNYGKFWRSMSNNTIFFNEKPTLQKIKEILELNKHNGEPGLLNAEAARKRRPNFQTINPCLTGDTMVLTRTGHHRIDSLIGKEVEIWDGDSWIAINNFRITAENSRVYDVSLYNGQKIAATKYHKFILTDGTKKILSELQPGDILLTHNQQIHGEIILKSAYAKGFLLGDGSVKNKKNPQLHLYFPKYCCETRLINSVLETSIEEKNTNAIMEVAFRDEKDKRKEMVGLSARSPSFLPFCHIYKRGLPDEFLNWSYKSKLDFLGGLFDADGTASDTKNGFLYQLCSVHKKLLLNVQLLLRTIGVTSKLSLMKKAGIQNFNDGYGDYPTKDCWRLTISQKSAIIFSEQVKFSRLVSFADKKTIYQLKNNESKVIDIHFSHVADNVYCCTVPTTHAFALSNGVMIGQCGEALTSRSFCNLVTVNMMAFVGVNNKIDVEGLCKVVKMMTRVSLRQTNVDIEMPEWDKNQKQERLLGVSLTGVMDFIDKIGINRDEFNKLLMTLRECANKEADIYSGQMNINRPYLVTLIKPEGTISQLPTVSQGIHRSFSPYYIRRVRITADDPLAKVMLQLGYPTYPENGQSVTQAGFDALGVTERRIALDRANTWVVEFPVASTARSDAYDEPIETQFQRYLDFQNFYTDHNTSVTLYVGDDEWDTLADLLYQNWDNYVAVSFLPKDKKSYPLMPLEKITKEEYNWRVSRISKIDLVELLTQYEQKHELHDLLDDGCAGGACPVR